MTTVHIIRHGETDWNAAGKMQGRKNSALTGTGIQQAQDLKQHLSSIAFDVAFSSSSYRAVHTANILLADRDIALQQDDQLCEINLGEWEGCYKTDIKQAHPQAYKQFWDEPHKFQAINGESFHDVQARAVNIFNQIVNAHQEKVILIVSHGAFIKTLLAHIDNRPLQNLWLPPKLYNCAHSIVKFNAGDQLVLEQYAGLLQW